MNRRRKSRIIQEAAVYEDDGLRMEVRDLLHAFKLAEPHAKGRSAKERLANQQEVALGLIDWAICETDRGAQLLKDTTRESYDG